MTTAQHTSYMNANLPNLKAQSNDLGDAGVGGLPVKEEREQFVPVAPTDKGAARSDMPASPAASASDAAVGSPASAAGREEHEKQLLAIDEISLDVNGDVLVKVPADLVGRMIGKHGTVIKELQLQSGAFINMSKDGEVFRIARISGGFAEARLCACLLVEKFTLADHAEKRARLEELIAHFRVAANRPQRQYLVESFALPTDALARITGRGGQLLRELQDKTRAKIDLPRSTGVDEPRKVVTISGTAAEVAACRDMLRSIAHEHPMLHPEEGYYGAQHYDPAHVVPTRGPYYGQPYPMPPYAMHPYAPSHPASAGGSLAAAAASTGYVDSYNPSPYVMAYPGGYYPEQMTPDLSRLSLDGDDHVVPREGHMAMPMAPMPPMPIAESIVSIPGEMVGRLIGRQGVAVKQLQNETRTRIDILDPAPNTSNAIRYVRVTGPKFENVQHCVHLIQTRVSAFWSNAPMSPASVHH